MRNDRTSICLDPWALRSNSSPLRAPSALRVVALGRKNFLFVGDTDKGANLAGLYSLVATCEANDVDPVAYLRDVLLRVDTHPPAAIDHLLPHRWQPPITVEVG